MTNKRKASLRSICFGAGTLVLAAAALAQPIYRSIGPDGKPVFSDQAPAANAAPAARGTGGGTTASPAIAAGGLPYELRQVVQRYPVTLYTGDDCAPCSAGRSMLTTRGVPFDERTVKSNDDIAALLRLAGQNTLPLLTIGAQQLKGYSDSEWSQYLDAAGYPKSNSLPAAYRNAAAQPMVAARSAAAPTTAPASGPAVPLPQAAPAPASGPTPSNPAGIKF